VPVRAALAVPGLDRAGPSSTPLLQHLVAVVSIGEAEHLPLRPSYDCSACGERWPCDPAKIQLAREFEGESRRLTAYMGDHLHDALHIAIKAHDWDKVDDSMAALSVGPCHPRTDGQVLRNPLIVAMSDQLNVDVCVLIRDVYVEVEGIHTDSVRGVVVLELDEEALKQALGESGRWQLDRRVRGASLHPKLSGAPEVKPVKDQRFGVTPPSLDVLERVASGLHRMNEES
jgi:hypothetical protein